MSNPTSSDLDSYVTYLTYIRSVTVRYFLLSTFPIGVIGNLISIFVYARPNLNKNNTNAGFLYIWLCVSNLCMMIYFVFVYQSSNLFGYSISFTCGFSTYLYRSVLCFVPWMQVVACLDRFFVVVFPHKRRLMAKKLKQQFQKEHLFLMEELPKLYASRIDYIKPCVTTLIGGQAKFYQEYSQFYEAILNESSSNTATTSGGSAATSETSQEDSGAARASTSSTNSTNNNQQPQQHRDYMNIPSIDVATENEVEALNSEIQQCLKEIKSLSIVASD